MIISHTLEQYQESNVVLGKKEENYNNKNNYYIKINYFDGFVSLNSLSFVLSFKNMVLMSMYNYTKINFNVSNNIDIIKTIQEIEENLLRHVNKQPKFSLYSILAKGFIKVPTQQCCKKVVILRIYGIWESHDLCGLKYKFLVY